VTFAGFGKPFGLCDKPFELYDETFELYDETFAGFDKPFEGYDELLEGKRSNLASQTRKKPIFGKNTLFWPPASGLNAPASAVHHRFLHSVFSISAFPTTVSFQDNCPKICGHG
jgi:hypothetical protein